MLDENLRSQLNDPLDPVLSHLGLGSTLRLLTTGAAPVDGLQGYGETFLATPRSAAPEPDALLKAFQIALVSSAPYGDALGAEGKIFVARDPYSLGAPTAVLSDESWLELQAICSQ